MGFSVCLACGSWTGEILCAACRATLAPSPAIRLTTGLVVRPAFRHDGAARRLVHRMKYQGAIGAALPLAAAMAAGVPSRAGCLVPVPRAGLRRWRHGADPARALAAALGGITGLPVVPALRAPWWWPAHAGRGREARSAPAFRAATAPSGAVLVDDVLTTGATLAAAAAAMGVGPLGAVTAAAAAWVAKAHVPCHEARASDIVSGEPPGRGTRSRETA